jgi:hypothetical protein
LGLSILAFLIAYTISISNKNFLERWFDKKMLVNEQESVFYESMGQPIKKRVKDSYYQLYRLNVFTAIVLISVVPTISFFYYSFYLEKKLQIKSRQVYLAQAITKRNEMIDTILDNTKISNFSTSFRDSLKYNKEFGIYAAYSDIKKEDPIKDTVRSSDRKNFYKGITEFLFLPADHVDFYDNSWYHSWSKRSDTLQLFYNESVDVKQKSFSVNTALDKVDLNLILLNFFKWSPLDWIIVLLFIIFLYSHYQLIKALINRVFLVSFINDLIYKDRNLSFNNNGAAPKDCDTNWIDTILQTVHVSDYDLGNFAEDDIGRLKTYDFLVSYEDGLMENRYVKVLRMQKIFTPAYETIWSKCSENEQYVLYDLALDGFTNYKTPDILYSLFKKGLLRIDKNDSISIMNYSFRNYLASKSNTNEIASLKQKVSKGGTWKMIQNVFMVILLMIFVYLIITQQEFSARVAAIISGLVTLMPALIRLFDKKTPAA